MTARGHLALPASESWVTDVPCAGRWYMTDPGMAAKTRTDSLIVACLPGLALCRECPFVARCLDRVKPAESWYDGVCGGHVWRNGKVVFTPLEARDAA